MRRASFVSFLRLGILVSWLAPIGFAQSIKPGTEIKVRLVENLDADVAKGGQSFSATLAEPVGLENKKVLARGTHVNGMVTETIASGQFKRPASITLALISVEKTPVRTETLKIDSKSYAMPSTAATGAVASARTSNSTGKQEIVLPSDTELTFVVANPPATVTKTPEPVVERNTDRTIDSKPAVWHDDSRDQKDDAYDALIFSDRDKWLIRSYFHSNYGNLPLGLAQRGGDLPPDLEKKMRRDGDLPPDLQKRIEPLPAELQRQLPSLPSGYSRVFLSGRVLILADDGQVVDLMFIYR